MSFAMAPKPRSRRLGIGAGAVDERQLSCDDCNMPCDIATVLVTPRGSQVPGGLCRSVKPVHHFVSYRMRTAPRREHELSEVCNQQERGQDVPVCERRGRKRIFTHADETGAAFVVADVPVQHTNVGVRSDG